MDSESNARAEGATYAGVRPIPPQYMQLTLKRTKDWDTVNVMTSTIEDTQSGRKSELSTTTSDVNTSGQ